MLKRIKALKNQKGFTLVELLAVIVILGIIAAIAVPSIGGIIEKSKADAHNANALQIISAAKLAQAANDVSFTNNNTKASVTLSQLNSAGYLDSIPSDPDNDKAPYLSSSSVTITKVNNVMTYSITLKSNKDLGKKINKTYYNNILEEDLKTGNTKPNR